jgi:uncharacterized sulfatase
MKRVVLMLILLFSATSNLLAAERPNVLVIFTDDHGWADLGVQGIQKDIRTPNLDKLAADGVRFTNGYVTAPQCVPSRAGLISGCYQQRFGLESNRESLDGFNAVQTFPARLQKLGYVTGMTGKWHLGPVPEITKHGFDKVFTTQGQTWSNFDLDGNARPGSPYPSDLYHLEANAEAACTFIKKHKNEPFFFYLAFRAPHTPLDAPIKYTSRFPEKMPERRRQALAMLSAVDDGVGRVVQTLRELKLEEKTLIFFIGDNGAPLKINKPDTSFADIPAGADSGWDGSLNEPMNGEKGMLSEGGIRIPFLCSWKGTIPDGIVFHHPVISLDVAATALELAGEKILENDLSIPTDGVNLLPYLKGEKTEPPHKILFWRWLAQSAVREGKWKLLQMGTHRYLFNIEADSGEKHNMIAEHADIVQRLQTQLEQWAANLQPPGLNAFSTEKNNIWDGYFEYYLEGKSASQINLVTKSWIVRNGTGEIKNHIFYVTADKKNPPLFITNSQLNINAATNVSLHLTLRSAEGNCVEVAWRTEEQKDFLPEQKTWVAFTKSGEWQELNIPIPPTIKHLIHLRIFLPGQTNEIKEITIRNEHGQTFHQWNF